MRTAILATTLCLLAAAPSGAAPGGLDPTFGKGGVVLSNYAVYDGGYAITATSDGKVVVAGEARVGLSRSSKGTFVLARHLANGKLDPSFGKGGIVRTTVDKRGHGAILEMLQYADGKLLVAGITRGGGSDAVVVARYLADGKLDKTFSDDGLAIASVKSLPPVVTGLGFLPDGGIVVCGTIGTGFNKAAAFVQRFSADGRLDPSFGTDGTLYPTIGTNPWVMPNGLAVLPDTSVVLAGDSWNDKSGETPFVVRILPTGALDPVFGAAIPAALPGGDLQTVERTVDGMVLVGGAAPRSPGEYVYSGVVARLLPTGVLDPTFGTQGVARVTGNVTKRVFDIVPVSAGRYVALGASWESRGLDTMLWRLTPLGAADTAFGPGGVRIRSLSPAMDVAWVGVAGPNDSITTAGAAYPRDYTKRDTLVARFLGT